MSSRLSAARPNRAGEDFARAHHGEAGGDHGNAKFDVRNPSILAPDSREEDAVLDADVIGSRGSTKRGAVNLDGYDSDSDNETFNAKAAGRKKGKVDINEQLDNYDAARSAAASGGNVNGHADDDDDGNGNGNDDEDMFAMGGEADAPIEEEDVDFDKSGKKKTSVQFLDATQIMGQEHGSKSGGHVRLDDQDSEDDELEAQLAALEEGVDEEVGAGGLKRNAPKVEAFNLQAEMEEGQFDQSGNYVRKAADPDAVHDNWLDGVSKKDMKKAAAAHEKRAAEARRQRLEEADVLVSDLLGTLILRLEPSESPLEALARLGRGQTRTKKIPKWKLKKMNKGSEDMEVDDKGAAQDVEQTRIKESINAITDAADKLLSRDYEEVYDQDRELLMRAYRRETGEDWVEPASQHQHEDVEREVTRADQPIQQWEFRWTDGRDGETKQGPFDQATMKAWQDAGYFAQGIEFRVAGGGDDGWTTTANFAS
ncbi:Lin1 family protein [Metarhizium album ARSEF 1941]|uniref:Lin1 family protein n=1 Tax=Metarhizium album (strain ARSEF 1941) TaxID=1081103 RepID=A0A0B2X0G8_METAS|nr:Lin1 family protein [Metarhizium album ARSEF 1941]KHO02037.1 Lin1 family protein [Metarhizium album ARSEF 1941]